MMIWDIPRQHQIQKPQKVENLENLQNQTNHLKICCPPQKNAKSAWHKLQGMYIMEQQLAIHVKHFFVDRFNWAQHLNTPAKPKETV